MAEKWFICRIDVHCAYACVHVWVPVGCCQHTINKRWVIYLVGWNVNQENRVVTS